jgi:hypothetical protein
LEVQRTTGKAGVVVNSGCWLKQLQPVRAHLGSPSVFVPAFMQTHVRVSCTASPIRVELGESPKPAQYNLPFTERLTILVRQPAKPVKHAKPRVRVAAEW